jgi:hypothetical protein
MLRAAFVAVLAIALLPAAASADVLIQRIPKRLMCGDPINPGIWAQPGTTGDKTVRMKAVDRRSGVVWWRKTATATSRRWRQWVLPSGKDGRCGPTTFVYRFAGTTVRYKVRFRSEGV